MAIHLTYAAANACAGDAANDGLRAYIGATPKLKFFTGNQNADPEADPAGTLISTHTLAAFGAVSNGAITSVNATSDATTVAGGTIACWALYLTNGTTKVLDGSAAKISGGDINLDENVVVGAGATVKMGNLVLTMPRS
jgi:hypothetical protein